MHWTRYTKAGNICQPWLSLLPDKLQYPCHFKRVYYFLVKSKGGNITDERRLVRHFKPGCINPVKKGADEFQNRALESFVLGMHRKLMGFLSCFMPLPRSPEPPAWLTQSSINHSMPFIYLSALSSELVTHQPLAKAVHESSMEDIAKWMQQGGWAAELPLQPYFPLLMVVLSKAKLRSAFWSQQSNWVMQNLGFDFGKAVLFELIRCGYSLSVSICRRESRNTPMTCRSHLLFDWEILVTVHTTLWLMCPVSLVLWICDLRAAGSESQAVPGQTQLQEGTAMPVAGTSWGIMSGTGDLQL